MAGTMRKMGEFLGLVTHEVYDDYDTEEYELPRQVHAAQHPEPRQAPRPVTSISDHRIAAPAPSASAPSALADVSRIEMISPQNYNDARPIGESFRSGVPVIMNLSDISDDDAKRLVDFAAGLVFAARGSINRITAKVFLLSPENVEVSDEDKAAIAAGGFYNQS